MFDTNGKRLSPGTDYEVEMDTDNHTTTIQGGETDCIIQINLLPKHTERSVKNVL